MEMAASNPWARDDPRARRYPVSLGGIKALAARNQLLPASDASTLAGSSSRELMARIRGAAERMETLFSDVRELERLEAAAATASCTEPLRLQQRLARARNLRDDLAALLDAKPVVLQTLRKSAAIESLDVELEHQRAFVDVFCRLGCELPRFAHVVRTLEGVESLANGMDESRREYERTVAELKATVAKYQDAFDDMDKLRAAYTELLSAPR